MGLLIKLCIVFQLIVKETESAVSLNLDTSGTGGYELRFGKSVRLNCTLTGSTCCPEARRWLIRSGGTFSSIINDGVSTDASKYEEDLQEASNQFNLIIKNFDIADVNLEYQCQYQFSTNEYTIQMSDGLIYIPTTNDINVISSDFQMTTFSYSVNITSVYPQPNCSCIYDGDDLTAQMTTTVGDNGVLKYAVLNLSNIAHTCSGEFRITCSIGSYNDQQIATTTPCPSEVKSSTPDYYGGAFGAAIVILIIIALVIICFCSNKNCKTYDKCWGCKTTCHSYYPIQETKASKDTEWHIKCFKNSEETCRRTIYWKWCCNCFGCFFKKLPVREQDEELFKKRNQTQAIVKQGTKTKHERKTKVGHSAIGNNQTSEPDIPVEKSKKDKEAVHIVTENKPKSESYPLVESPPTDINKLAPIDYKAGNVETTNSITPRPLPLPPIGTQKS